MKVPVFFSSFRMPVSSNLPHRRILVLCLLSTVLLLTMLTAEAQAGECLSLRKDPNQAFGSDKPVLLSSSTRLTHTESRHLAINLPARTSATRPFGLSLLKAAVEQSPGKNVLLSPYSAHLILSMAMSGAQGKTREEMSSMLNLSGLSEAAADENAAKMIKAFMSDRASNTIDVANAIFVDASFKVNPAYIDKCRKYYSAEARSLPFASPSSLSQINSWCSSKTNGRIPTILDRLDESQALVLINAVYFKGDWFEKFAKEKTVPEPFQLSNGSRKQVPMMRRSDSLDYFKTAGFSCACLPYEGEQLYLMVILPDQNKTVKDVIPLLAAHFPKEFEWTKVELSMPRFKIESTLQLPPYLKRLGMVSAFDKSSADFTFMTPDNKGTHISQVVHKTYMSVDEEGTEAAAATAVSIPKGIERPDGKQVVEFKVDRPFLIAIVHDEIDELLFLGAVNEPE